MLIFRSSTSLAIACTLLGSVACRGSGDPSNQAAGAGSPRLIAIDGSSTVFPITEAVAEEFRKIGRAHV